mmetsp:Transcript_43236/g.65338  ORF Transcript_43236/g.65338 Transcript_43236/m.65338 type:complete len:86 (-) Transcript_43236:74-331(-)
MILSSHFIQRFYVTFFIGEKKNHIEYLPHIHTGTAFSSLDMSMGHLSFKQHVTCIAICEHVLQYVYQYFLFCHTIDMLTMISFCF